MKNIVPLIIMCTLNPLSFAKSLEEVGYLAPPHSIRVANNTNNTILRIHSGNILPRTQVLLPGQKTEPLKNNWLNHMKVEFLARGNFISIPHCHHGNLMNFFPHPQLFRVEDGVDELGIPICKTLNV